MAKSTKKLVSTTQPSTEKELRAFEKNHAADNAKADAFFSHVNPLIDSTRKNRISMEQQWLLDYQRWSCLLDNQGYVGRSNIFVPELNNQIEQTVEKDLANTFSSPDLVYAVPKEGATDDQAHKVKEAVLYEIEDRNKGVLLLDEHKRQKALLGTSVIKAGFKKEIVDIYIRDKDGRPCLTQVPKYVGTKLDVVDMFRWYIFPETSDLETCYMIFEDQLVDLVQEKLSGLYQNLENVQPMSDVGEGDLQHKWVDLQRRDFLNLGSMLRSRPNCAVFTEVWMNYDLYGDGKPIPVLATIANYKTVVRLVRNPLWLQRHPYAGTRHIRRPGKMFYGLSVPDRIRSQTDVMNDVQNQTMDSLNFSLSPISIIDPALAGDVNSFKYRPGAKWLGSPEGVEFKIFPDVSGAGLRYAQELRGQIAQFSDNNPNVAPQLSGKSRSATQSSIVAGAVSQRQKVQLLLEEHETLVPLCENIQSLLVQYMDKNWQIKVQGPVGGTWITKNITPQDINATVDWVWRGAEQEEKSAVRSQQLLAFYNSALQTASLMPGEVDLPGLFKRIAKEAFNLRDMDEIFKSMRDQKTIDPDVENVILSDGKDQEIHNGDNDQEHILAHEPLLDDNKINDEGKLAVLRHLERHKIQMKAKQAVLEAKGRLQTMQMLAQQGGDQSPQGSQGGQDGRTGPQVPSPMEGNQAQASTSPDAIMSGVRGVQPQ
jgi:hypothetical protein